MSRRQLLRLAFGLVIAGVGTVRGLAAQSSGGATILYLVRHAEKVDASADPDLSASGRVRSDVLAHVLADAGLTGIYSTDFKRTRQTAAPTAEALHLPIASYNPRDLTGFAAQVKTQPGRFLIVGHSNTTPALVRALGGDPVRPIPDIEYDRLYLIVIRDGTVSSTLLRFGAPSPS